MLEPLSPSHIPEKLPDPPEDKHINPAAGTGSGGGYRFNLFGRSKKRKQSDHDGESDQSSVYNEEKAVDLHLSPEAIEKIKRQRDLKKKRSKDRDE